MFSKHSKINAGEIFRNNNKFVCCQTVRFPFNLNNNNNINIENNNDNSNNSNNS